MDYEEAEKWAQGLSVLAAYGSQSQMMLRWF